MIDSRSSVGGTIRRRRQCLRCQERFWTRELIEHESPTLDSWVDDQVLFVSASELQGISRELIRLMGRLNRMKRGD